MVLGQPWVKHIMETTLTPITNKAIREGKYLALPHSSDWQRSPHFFRDVISLLARVFIFLIDRATQEVPITNF